MESQPRRRTKPRVARVPLGSALWTVALSAGAAAILLIGFISVQMARGQDPALGPKLASTQAKSNSGGSGATAVDDSESAVEPDEGTLTVVPSAPQTSVPQTVVPAAPAPAPAPAPVQTSTS